MPKETLLSTIRRLNFCVYIFAILSSICSVIMLVEQSATDSASNTVATLTFASAFLFFIFFIVRSFKSQKLPPHLSTQTISDYKIFNQYIANSIITLIVAIIIGILGIIGIAQLIQLFTAIRLPFGHGDIEIIYNLGVPIAIILITLTLTIFPLLYDHSPNNSLATTKQPAHYYRITQVSIFAIIISIITLVLLPISPWLALLIFL